MAIETHKTLNYVKFNIPTSILKITDNPLAVSYTHLDVYKRQPFAERGKDATSDEDKLGLHEKPRVMIFPP